MRVLNTLLRVPFRMHSTGWLLLAGCLLIGFRVGGFRLAVPAGLILVASLLLHELGHMAVATILYVPVREFGLRLGGAYNRRAYATRRRDEVLISAAGPATNLLLCVPMIFIPQIGPLLAIGNFALGVVNLLPLPSSDGLRIFRLLWRTGAPGTFVPALYETPSR